MMWEYRLINARGDVLPASIYTGSDDIPEGYWMQQRYTQPWEDR